MRMTVQGTVTLIAVCVCVCVVCLCACMHAFVCVCVYGKGKEEVRSLFLQPLPTGEPQLSSAYRRDTTKLTHAESNSQVHMS